METGSEPRYSRQILLPEIGPEGQKRLGSSRLAVVGCGALGSAIAALLVRAGVASLCIIDRDFVEPSNLQRQLLFDEADAKAALPKAIAAERHLRATNAEVEVEGIVADVTPRNVEQLLAERDLILDGTDNFETRFLVNDFAVKSAVPWIYSAVVGMRGVCLPIVPGKTACLACLAGSESGETLADEATCDTVGVLGAAATAVASLAVAAAIRMLTGSGDQGEAKLISADVWNAEQRSIRVARDPDCRACGRGEFTYLEGAAQPHVTMCGRDSVQIHERNRRIDLMALGARLRAIASDVRRNDFLLRFRVAPYEVTVFSDGRAIIKGTRDPGVARSLYARYLGA